METVRWWILEGSGFKSLAASGAVSAREISSRRRRRGCFCRDFACVVDDIGAHTTRKFERAQVRAVNADINVTVLGPNTRPYIIFGADSKCQLVAISTVEPWNGHRSARVVTFSQPPFNSTIERKGGKNPIQTPNLPATLANFASKIVLTIPLLLPCVTGDYYFPFERREQRESRCL